MRVKKIKITAMILTLAMATFAISTIAQGKTGQRQWRGCCPGCWMSTSMVRVSETATEPNVQPTKGSVGWMCTCPWRTMAWSMQDTQGKGFDTGDYMCRDMMKKMGMSDAMMMRCNMMMRAGVSQNDPAGILALKETLNLTEEQINKLESIAKAAQKQAEAVLTEDQKQKLTTLPETPDSMIGMNQWMMPKMHEMIKEKGGWMCPWMQVPSESNDAQLKSFEQTTCPVMGGPINSGIYTEYRGKKVYFCCPECKGRFEANPEKYLEKLPQFN